MKAKIEVDNWTIARFWLILIAILGAGGLIYISRSALVLIFMAIFLAVALDPLVEKISKKLKNNRTAGTSIIFVGLLIVLIGFGALIVPSMIRQFSSFANSAPKMISNTVESISNHSLFKSEAAQKEIEQVLITIDQNKQSWATKLGSTVFSKIGSIIGGGFSLFVILTLTFLMLIESKAIMKQIWKFYDNPKMAQQHKRLAGKFYNVITSFVGGQLTIAGINAVLAAIVIFILSLIFSVSRDLMAPVGLMVGVIGLIPMIGATLGGILATILVAFTSFPAAIIFIIYYIIYQQVENNVIIPTIQSKTMDLSALTVLIAVTVGIYLFGILGGLVSIPFAACLKVLLEENFSALRDE